MFKPEQKQNAGTIIAKLIYARPLLPFEIGREIEIFAEPTE
jgi:hypothetical protein